MNFQTIFTRDDFISHMIWLEICPILEEKSQFFNEKSIEDCFFWEKKSFPWKGWEVVKSRVWLAVVISLTV